MTTHTSFCSILLHRLSNYYTIKKNHFDSQCGRSMVEMLGVLAIMSILAITGILWYSVAMNKYKAIEILAEAHKRAAVVAAHIAAGGEGVQDETDKNIWWFPIDEFIGSETYGAAFEMDVAHSDKKLYVELTVSEAICNQMKAVVANDPRGEVTIERNCKNAADTGPYGGIAVVFNDDLDIGVGTKCTSDSGCTGCQTCQEGVCRDTNAICPNGFCKNGACLCEDGRHTCGTQCCRADELCTNQTCTPPEGTCASNNQCTADQYCNLVPKVYHACHARKGSCQSKGTLRAASYNHKTFYISDMKMTWEAAENFCLAHNKKLATLSSLGMTQYYKNYDGANCITYECYDEDGELIEGVSTEEGCAAVNGETWCIVLDQGPLARAFGSTSLWTGTLHATDTCKAIYISTQGWPEFAWWLSKYRTLSPLCE